METVRLIIKRKTSYVGLAMPVRIYINRVEIGKLMVGKSIELEIDPVHPTTVRLSMVGNSMNIHRIEEQFVIDPTKAPRKVVNCEFSIKGSALGILSSGFGKAVGEIKTDIKYY